MPVKRVATTVRKSLSQPFYLPTTTYRDHRKHNYIDNNKITYIVTELFDSNNNLVDSYDDAIKIVFTLIFANQAYYLQWKYDPVVISNQNLEQQHLTANNITKTEEIEDVE